ncbi:hypothetical protein C5167_037967 [Papaver somniferum]|uniref:Rhodanese domain-containing protein n=1 Tax=Papaver somniferum TaxID=3469 RepID=A0A4Y7I7V8_PAPSO|nr:thiosulfate sulfurtransferase 16, chloroplastic-like [Papaver somniferum]RZC45023.1 hypothetical protein C5167_037967 [Papaver somniferum]
MAARSLIKSALPLLVVVRPQNLTRLRHLTSIVTNPQHQQQPKPAFAGNKNHGLLSDFRVMSMSTAASTNVTKSVHVSEAHALVQAGHHYLDVRSAEEFTAGHPPGAVNVPYLFKYGDDSTKNPNFVEEVSKLFKEDAEIVVGCLKGIRSLKAAADLSNAGFKNLTDVAGGYQEWTKNGLPIE